MSSGFPKVALGELLTKSENWIDIRPDKQYKQVTVKLWGKGVALRTQVNGSEIASTRQVQVEREQFILSKIDARNGAFGLIPDSLDGALVSPDFPVFSVNYSRILPKFLDWMSKTSTFVELSKSSSEGTTNRVRLQEARFLASEIPLPPLEEQRRIIARIEELAAKVEEARGLRREIIEKTKIILNSAINGFWGNQYNWFKKPIIDLATVVSGQIDPRIEPYASLPHINGEAMESGTCRLLNYRSAKDDGVTSGKFHFCKGSILYSKIRPYLRKAVEVLFEGVCSADVYAFEAFDHAIEPRFFMYSLISPEFTTYANSLSGRTRMPKLNQKQLFAYQMSYPSLPEQRRIVAYLDELQARVDAVKQLQTETRAELDALLPSILDKAFRGELV